MDIQIMNKCWTGFFSNLRKEEKRQAVSSSRETYSFISRKKCLTNQARTARSKAVRNNQNRNSPLHSRSGQTSVCPQKTIQWQFRTQFYIKLI